MVYFIVICCMLLVDGVLIISLDDIDLIMFCYLVDSKDLFENVESKWVGEIVDNCLGVKFVLVVLKCDFCEGNEEEDGVNEDGNL